jgi:hypothetical protein
MSLLMPWWLDNLDAKDQQIWDSCSNDIGYKRSNAAADVDVSAALTRRLLVAIR